MDFDVPGDLALAANGTRFTMVSGAQRILQQATIACGFPAGTWRFDLNAGIPLQAGVLVLHGVPQIAANYFADRIRRIKGVASVEIVSVENTSDRGLYVKLAIKTQFGETVTVEYPGSPTE